jgi:putative phosphoribosyl transferase
MHRYVNRTTAGVALATALQKARLREPVLVLGLPRGGVPVAYEVARSLHVPLDVMVVRKIGMPGQPEYAIGAVASGDITVRDPGGTAHLAATGIAFEQIAQRERVELLRRERAFRRDLPPLELRDKTVVLVDDGLATGATMLAAVRAARLRNAASVIVAAPIASVEAAALVGAEADQLVILETSDELFAIGQWYEDFTQVSDAEVCALLDNARESVSPSRPGDVRRA